MTEKISGEKIFSTVDPSYNKLWKIHEILFDVVVKEKNKEVKEFLILYIFFILCMLCTRSHISYRFKIFIQSLCSHYHCRMNKVKSNIYNFSTWEFHILEISTIWFSNSKIEINLGLNSLLWHLLFCQVNENVRQVQQIVRLF